MIDEQQIEKAVDALGQGRLVSFPTETVYGLGADATNGEAVRSIYEVKGRPSNNPLIVHVGSFAMAMRYAKMTDLARELTAAFWPGALTLVLDRADDFPLAPEVSAGGDTVAIRCPEHKLVLGLINALGNGIAAPSANRSGRVSPTSAAHVRDELGDALGGKLAMILDDGECALGIESTVVDVRGSKAKLLRPGSVTLSALQNVLGAGRVVDMSGTSDDVAPTAPGQLTSHYAPSLPVKMNVLPDEVSEGEAYLGFGAHKVTGAGESLSESGNCEVAANRLFALLRKYDDAEKYHAICVAPIPNEGLGVAINDRLGRAAV